jgi:hypothetical protein
VGIFGHDQETVGASHGGQVAGTLPGDEGDFRDGAGKCAGGGKKARKACFRFHVLCEAGEGEARAAISLSGKCGDNGSGEEQERDGGRDRVAGKPEALRAVLVLD